MGTIRLGLNNDSEAVYSKTYLEVDYDNEEIKPEGDKITIGDSNVAIDLAIVIVKNGGIYTNAFQYFNDDIVKLAMIGQGTSKLYRVQLTTINNLCAKLSKFNLVLISGVCELINENETLLDILVDRYDVYDNLVFIDEGNVSLSLNTLFNNCMSIKNNSDTVIYSEVAVRDMLNTYNSYILAARLNTALLVSTLRARRYLYIDTNSKIDIENKLRDKYDSTLNKMLSISNKCNNFLVKKPGAIKDITNFVGYNKCTQLKRLVLATKNNFDDPEYSKLCTLLYNSTYKMLSYGFSYGVKMRSYDIEGIEIKLPFAFAVYNDINDKLFVDNKHYIVSFEFLGLLSGGVEKIYSDNLLSHSDFEVSGEIGSCEMLSRLGRVKELRKMVDIIDIESICQENYMHELTEIVVKLEKLGYYIYEFDRHGMSLIVNNMVNSDTALNDIHAVIENSFIEKAISRTHIIKDNTRRHWFIGYYGDNTKEYKLNK